MHGDFSCFRGDALGGLIVRLWVRDLPRERGGGKGWRGPFVDEVGAAGANTFSSASELPQIQGKTLAKKKSFLQKKR